MFDREVHIISGIFHPLPLHSCLFMAKGSFQKMGTGNMGKLEETGFLNHSPLAKGKSFTWSLWGESEKKKKEREEFFMVITETHDHIL